MKYWAKWISIGTLLGCATLLQAAQVCSTSLPASTPTADFVVDSVNGTVTHSKTGLMWQQCAQGLSGPTCSTGSATAKTWSAALTAAVADRTAGYSDWRLPNLKELRSIVEEQCYGPSINANVFPNTPASLFWSASAYANNSSSAWVVYFSYGFAGYNYKYNTYQVRLVRAGQSFGSFDNTAVTSLTAQTISFGTAPTVHVGGTGTVSATATSGLPVSFSSSSPSSVCTLTGSLVAGVGVGICTITATQAGDAAYAPAAPVLQAFSVTAVLSVPGAPSIVSITPGPGRLTITMQAPGNIGGGAIVSYSATCSASGHPSVTASSATPTVVVHGLVAGASYTCTATASNGSYTSQATPTSVAIPIPRIDLTPILMLLLD